MKNHSSIALVCTGSHCPDEQSVINAADYLKKHYGLQCIFDKDTHSYLSPNDRAEIFLKHLFNESVSTVFALRGGEGTADLIPFIHAQRDKISTLKPKTFIGFSDFTPLLIYFSQQFGWPVVHGPGAWRLSLGELDAESEKHTVDCLLQKPGQIVLNDLVALNNAAKQPGEIKAPLIGGTLSLLTISVKDSWEIDCNNKIVIIEDVHEKAHKVIRSLKHLSRIGKFDGAKAIVFGDFNTAPVGKNTVEQKDNAAAADRALMWFAKTCDFPVLQTMSFGHGKRNLPLGFSSDVTLALNETPSLEWNVGA